MSRTEFLKVLGLCFGAYLVVATAGLWVFYKPPVGDYGLCLIFSGLFVFGMAGAQEIVRGMTFGAEHGVVSPSAPEPLTKRMGLLGLAIAAKLLAILATIILLIQMKNLEQHPGFYFGIAAYFFVPFLFSLIYLKWTK